MKALTFAVLLTASIAMAPAFGRSSGGHSGSHRSSSLKASSGTTHVHGYTKKNGTRVAAYDKTSPNSTKRDNWSTKGNVNPETGKPGTVDPNR